MLHGTVQHSKGSNSHSQRLEACGKCFVHEIFPWGSTWLVWLCGQGSRHAARLQGGSTALSWGAEGCRETSLQAAMQHGALFLLCNGMHPTKECSWRSQGRREERWDRDWVVLRSVSQQCPGLWGEGRKHILFTWKNAAAATLITALQPLWIFFTGLNSLFCSFRV